MNQDHIASFPDNTMNNNCTASFRDNTMMNDTDSFRDNTMMNDTECHYEVPIKPTTKSHVGKGDEDEEGYSSDDISVHTCYTSPSSTMQWKNPTPAIGNDATGTHAFSNVIFETMFKDGDGHYENDEPAVMFIQGPHEQGMKTSKKPKKTAGFHDTTRQNSSAPLSSTDSDCSPGGRRTRPEHTLEETHFKLLILVALISLTTWVFCIIVLIGILRDDQVNLVPEKQLMIQIPCDNLTTFYPIAAWNKDTDQETLQRFEDAGITRVKDDQDDVISCRVSVNSLKMHMTRKEFDAVEGQVSLMVGETGPTLPHSAYTLSVKDIKTMREVKSFRQGIIIEEEGNYFVYFGIELDYTTAICKRLHHRNSITILYVEREGWPNAKGILAIEHSCVETTESEKTTGFNGGIYHLHANDKLFVQVSSTEIVGQSTANFLGVFRLSTH